ncbi:MAG: hypothetical protein QXO17_00360 [Nitrososphaerota archaeon]
MAYGAASHDALYYVLWGGLAVVIGVEIRARTVVNPFVAAGIALMLIAGLGAYAAVRRRAS